MASDKKPVEMIGGLYEIYKTKKAALKDYCEDCIESCVIILASKKQRTKITTKRKRVRRKGKLLED